MLRPLNCILIYMVIFFKTVPVQTVHVLRIFSLKPNPTVQGNKYIKALKHDLSISLLAVLKGSQVHLSYFKS